MSPWDRPMMGDPIADATMTWQRWRGRLGVSGTAGALLIGVGVASAAIIAVGDPAPHDDAGSVAAPSATTDGDRGAGEGGGGTDDGAAAGTSPGESQAADGEVLAAPLDLVPLPPGELRVPRDPDGSPTPSAGRPGTGLAAPSDDGDTSRATPTSTLDDAAPTPVVQPDPDGPGAPGDDPTRRPDPEPSARPDPTPPTSPGDAGNCGRGQGDGAATDCPDESPAGGGNDRGGGSSGSSDGDGRDSSDGAGQGSTGSGSSGSNGAGANGSGSSGSSGSGSSGSGSSGSGGSGSNGQGAGNSGSTGSGGAGSGGAGSGSAGSGDGPSTGAPSTSTWLASFPLDRSLLDRVRGRCDVAAEARQVETMPQLRSLLAAIDVDHLVAEGEMPVLLRWMRSA